MTKVGTACFMNAQRFAADKLSASRQDSFFSVLPV